MASPKRLALPTQGGESTWDSSRFTSETAWHKYQHNVHLRNILPDRNIELSASMFDEFYGDLQRRQWHWVLTKLPEKQINIALVKEFYWTSMNQSTTLQNTIRCRGMSSGLMQRRSTTSLTPQSPLLIERNIRRTLSTYHHGSIMHTRRRVRPERWRSPMEAVVEGFHYARSNMERTFLL